MHIAFLQQCGKETFASQFGIDLEAAAAETEAKWLASQLYDDYSGASE
jgi:hypothetical protein